VEPAAQLRQKLTTGLSGKPHREEAIALLDSALTDETLPREVVLHLMGVGIAPGVERIAQMLRDQGQEVRLKTLNAHHESSGRMFLSRPVEEVAEVEEAPSTTATTLDGIREQAKAHGLLEPFDHLVEIATSRGLQVRPYKRSIMITPPHLANTFLMVASPTPGGLRMNHATVQWAQHFPWIPPEAGANVMGQTKRGTGRVVSSEDLPAYLEAIDRFLAMHFPAPEGYETVMDPGAPWTQEAFLLKLASQPTARQAATRLMDGVGPEGRVEFGRSAVGQAYLRYRADAPAVLQLRGSGSIRGMWSMTKTHPGELPAWAPLKEVLAPLGGLSPTGGAPAVDLQSLTAADVDALEAAAKTASKMLLETMGTN
jgi:hypothetical protein